MHYLYHPADNGLRFRNIAMKTAYSNNIHNKVIVVKCVDVENKKFRLIFAEKK
jgi:hypothetical protein